MSNILKSLVENQINGINVGVYSACSANEYVIRAVLRNSLRNDTYAIIESTANQCNQFGGYTGMTPLDFKEFVEGIAVEENFDLHKLILGGDHLGPLIWTDLGEEEAMKHSKELIHQYIMAGFTKIHLDTSMRIKGDDEILTDEIIARRSAELAVVAKNSYLELKKINPDAIMPVFIIGSEVPIPGGSQEVEEITITSPKDLSRTIDKFKEQYTKHNILDIWEEVIAVVVQPGVEFGDATIDEYNREKASSLVEELSNHNIIFEGHSTDYQTKKHLTEMVQDGVKILKVGPGLTFALREALFSLSLVEDALLVNSTNQSSGLIEILEKEMLNDDIYWKKYYSGSDTDQYIKRKYSFSDRIRYYLPKESVVNATKTLINNLNQSDIPLSLLSQFMPAQYNKVRNGEVSLDAEELVISRIDESIQLYIESTNQERLGKI